MKDLVDDVQIEPQEGTRKADEPEDSEEVEDGVTVRHAKAPVWCLKGGKIGLCAANARDCAAASKRVGGSCSKASSWACTWWTLRTSGQARSACLATYRECDAMAELMLHDTEVSNLKECIIFRTP